MNSNGTRKKALANNESTEMYLKVIYEVWEEGSKCRVTQISEKLHIAPPSVTEMLEKLAKSGLITHKKYGTVALTKKGRRHAMKIVRRYRLIQRFLHDFLKVSDPNDSACKMEHALDEEVDRRICIMMNRPLASVDSKPIPHCSLKIECADCIRHSKDVKPIPFMQR